MPSQTNRRLMVRNERPHHRGRAALQRRVKGERVEERAFRPALGRPKNNGGLAPALLVSRTSRKFIPIERNPTTRPKGPFGPKRERVPEKGRSSTSQQVDFKVDSEPERMGGRRTQNTTWTNRRLMHETNARTTVEERRFSAALSIQKTTGL